MNSNDSGISEARDRLRNKARNEQTSVALNNLLRLAEEEILRLKEENEQLADGIERCYRMLLSEPDVKGALFKAENILRESLADRGKK